MKKQITGKIVFNNFEGGFWGIESSDGSQWRPLKMPEQLKREGSTVTVWLQEVEENFSFFMWGTPVEIIGFSTF